MNPNPEVWGEPASWQAAKNIIAIAGDSELKCQKPRIANFGSSNGTLAAGNTAGKTPINQTIDLSICPCGQDTLVSPFSKLRIFKNHQDADLNKVPEEIIETDTPCNWFIYDAEGTPQSWQTNHHNEEGAAYRWAPNATITGNINGNINPYVFWQLKSLLIGVEVATISGYSASGIPVLYYCPLEEWKTTYSSRKICDVRLLFLGVESANNSGISYYTTPAQTNGKWGGIASFGKKYKNTENYYTYCFIENMIFDVIGNIDGNWYASSNIYTMNNSDMFHNVQLKSVVVPNDTDHGWQVWNEIPYSEDNYNMCLSIASLFGIPFTPTSTRAFDIDFTDEDLYLPIIDDDGIAHGDYTHGTGNTENDLYNADSVRDKNYNPLQPVDPNHYSNVTGFNYITEGAAMTVRYVLDGDNVNKLLSDLWTINSDIAQGDYEYFDGKLKDEYLTTNPIDCIVNLIRYPFNIPYQLQPLQSYVKLGKTAGTAKGWTTVYIANQINFKGIDIFPRFGNSFLDYEPYTSYELYVPFCGTIKIRAADILGHTLNLTLLIDLITGSCTAYVKADQLVIETLQGSCGVAQQISGTDTATMNANIFNGILATKQAKAQYLGHAAGALMPTNWINPAGYATKGEQVESSYKSATYAIEHMEAPVHSQGAASPLLGWAQEFNARLLIYYPEGDVIQTNPSPLPPGFNADALATFGHLKGFATVQPGTVNNFRVSGRAAFLSGDIMADAIPCTQSERAKIKSFFATGVFLPPLS